MPDGKILFARCGRCAACRNFRHLEVREFAAALRTHQMCVGPVKSVDLDPEPLLPPPLAAGTSAMAGRCDSATTEPTDLGELSDSDLTLDKLFYDMEPAVPAAGAAYGTRPSSPSAPADGWVLPFCESRDTASVYQDGGLRAAMSDYASEMGSDAFE